jgi:glycosyltransferase involved in cell wall biosynthesis
MALCGESDRQFLGKLFKSPIPVWYPAGTSDRNSHATKLEKSLLSQRGISFAKFVAGDICLKVENQKYRILLVVPYTLPDYSGSGINAFQFARFLRREGERASLLTFNRNLKLKSKEIVDGVTIRRIAYFNRNLLTKILSVFIIFPAYLVNILVHDIILIYGAHVIGYQILIVLGRLLGKKVLLQSLLLGADDVETILAPKSRLSRIINHSVLKQISLYFAINPEFARIYQEHMPKKCRVLVSPQGFDPVYFHPATQHEYAEIRKRWNIDTSCLVILSVGFVITRKGYKEIFEKLAELDLDFRYYIVGEYEFGPGHFLSNEAIRAQKIKQFGEQVLGDRVHFEGPQKQMLEYYQMSDIVLFNAKQEGTPNTLLEAMASGKPVLARKIPGLSDYIIFHEKNGLLFTGGHEITTLVRKLNNDPALRMDLADRAADFILREADFGIVWQRLLAGLYGEQEK